jgi:uncharacterized protein (DUF924 family)
MDLKPVITHDLLIKLYRARLPWEINEKIAPRDIVYEIFENISGFYAIAVDAWPALKAISTHGPDSIPDMYACLPTPGHPEFLQLSLGMHVLLDQATRYLFHGIDKRWMVWFDLVAREYSRKLRETLVVKQLYARAHWTEASFEYWLCTLWLLNTIAVHSEELTDQEDGIVWTEHMRRELEKHTGKRDPARDQDGLQDDIYAFPGVMRDESQFEDNPTLDRVGFWLLKNYQLHIPIIRRFGRNPYRNSLHGRESTEEEREWMEKTDHWLAIPLEIERQIKEDVVAQRWTPLGAGEPSP